MSEAETFRPGYNPEFLARVREKQKQERMARDRELRAARKLAEKERQDEIRRRAALAQKAYEQEKKYLGKQHELEAQKRFQKIMSDMWMRSAETGENINRPRPLASEIIAEIASLYGISYDSIVGQTRTKRLIQIRHEAIAEVRIRRPDMSLPQIGKVFNRDHTTILHALQKLGVPTVI